MGRSWQRMETLDVSCKIRLATLSAIAKTFTGLRCLRIHLSDEHLSGAAMVEQYQDVSHRLQNLDVLAVGLSPVSQAAEKLEEVAFYLGRICPAANIKTKVHKFQSAVRWNVVAAKAAEGKQADEDGQPPRGRLLKGASISSPSKKRRLGRILRSSIWLRCERLVPSGMTLASVGPDT